MMIISKTQNIWNNIKNSLVSTNINVNYCVSYESSDCYIFIYTTDEKDTLAKIKQNNIV